MKLTTPEQIAVIKKMNELKRLRNALNDQIADLSNELLSLSPFKAGDKVNVLSGYDKSAKWTECFVGKVYLNYADDEYRYEFKKIKKDGTMGGQSAGIYSPREIHLLSSDKNGAVSDTTDDASSNTDH